MRAPQRDICQEKLTEHLLCQLEPLKVGEDWSLDNMEKPGASRRRLLQRSLPSICKPGDSFPRRLRRKLVKKLWEAATDDKSSSSSSLERRKKKYNYSMSSSFQRILFSRSHESSSFSDAGESDLVDYFPRILIRLSWPFKVLKGFVLPNPRVV